MQIPVVARLAGIVTVLAGLSACVDVQMDINVLSGTTARGTMTMTIDKSMYAMVNAQDGQSDFCAEGQIIEEETVVNCVDVKEGPFDELQFGDNPNPDEPQVTIVAQDGGRVRVTFPTSSIRDQMGEDMSDPQAQAMMTAMFEGHSMVLRVSGGPIVDTNMELAPDGQSASLTIPFTDLFGGTVELPDEAFAVVQK